MNKWFMQLPLRIRQALVGSALTISLGGGSLVFTSGLDGCQVEYVVKEDKNGATAVDKNGVVLKVRSK